MTMLDFKRTTKNLGNQGSAYVSVGYQKTDGTDVWEDVTMTNDRGRQTLPDETKTFVVRIQVTSDAGGVIELELKNGEKVLKPPFKREVKPKEGGKTFLAYRVYQL